MDHLQNIDEVLDRAYKALYRTTTGELFKTYVDLAICYQQTIALLELLPGKNLTGKIMKQIEVETRGFNNLPFSPIELYCIIPYDENQANEIAKSLDIEDSSIRVTSNHLVNMIKKVKELIKREYFVDDVKKYYDEYESSFLKFLNDYYLEHIQKLAKIEGTKNLRNTKLLIYFWI